MTSSADRRSTRLHRRCAYGHRNKGVRPAALTLADRRAYYARRRQHARQLPLGREGREAIGAAMAALPVAVRRAFSQGEWMSVVAQDSDLVTRKPARRRNVMAVVRVLAWGARWYPAYPDQVSDGMEMTTMPTWELLQERTGLSRSTVADILAWLRRRCWLGIVETGTTPQIRRGLRWPFADPHDGEGNRAAVYLLCVPTEPVPFLDDDRPVIQDQAVEDPGPAAGQDHLQDDVVVDAEGQVSGMGTLLGPLPGSVITSAENPYAGAREARAGESRSVESQTSRTKDSSTRGGVGIHSPVPCGRWTQRERLRAAETARASDPVLRTLSARAVRSLLTPWWAAGWTISDVISALNFQPSGKPWHARYQVSDLRNVAGWISWRLDHWRDAQGDPLPGVSQAQRDQNERERAKDEAFRAALAAADAPPVVPAHAAEGFAAFRAARRAMRK